MTPIIIYKYKMSYRYIVNCTVVALIIRVIMIIYGEFQDKHMLVPFTDIDYHVFSDAAYYVTEGASPYNRSTYRYTPILAILLTPNVYWTHLFGKLLFVFCDVLTGIMIYQIMRQVKISSKQASIYCSLWFFNPIPIVVSARGNGDSVVTMLVLMLTRLLYTKNVLFVGAVYGLTVHFKIYPIIYALTIYLSMNNVFAKNVYSNYVKWTFMSLLPNRKKIIFILCSAFTFVSLNFVFFSWYGWKFVFESFLYHIIRKDIRHNFSPYFYMLYLFDGTNNSVLVPILVFLPQLLLVVTISVKYYADLPYSWFLLTFVFVTTNKVCTSQYFLWYLSLFPFVIPTTNLSIKRYVRLIVFWFAGQGLWLLPAYLLEFLNQNTFLWIWLSGLVQLIINFIIMSDIVDFYLFYQKNPNKLTFKTKSL